MNGILLRLLLLWLLLGGAVSCTRPLENAGQLRIQLPAAPLNIRYKSQSAPAQNGATNSGATNSGAFQSVTSFAAVAWGQSDPMDYSDIVCYAVLLSNSSLPKFSCRDSNSDVVATPSMFGGLYPSGSTISLSDVPGGTTTIHLVGFASSSATACSSASSAGLSNFTELSQPHIVSEKTLEIVDGTNSVNMIVPLTLGGATAFNNCDKFLTPVGGGTTAPSPGPNVTANSVDSGMFSSGQTFNLFVTYSEMVTVAGVPQVVMDIGGAIRSANYVSGSGTHNLQFSYIVTAGDEDLNGITLQSINLNGGSITSSTSATPVSLTLVTLDFPTTLVDTVAPTGPSILIDSGAATTPTPNVNLTLGAVGAPFEMYITNTVGCGSGGGWETFSATKLWVLGGTGTQSVYVKFRDLAQNESACVSDTIDHVSAAALVISGASPHDFGPVAVGGSALQTFTISNVGTSPATAISGIVLTAPFSYVGGTYPGGGNCTDSLAPAANCTIIVEFAPPAPGSFAGTINLSYSNGVSVLNSTRGLEGTATAGLPSFSFLALGQSHSCGFSPSGMGSCWGQGTEGQLGNGSNSDSASAVGISGSIEWAHMDSFSGTVCGVDASQNGYCWGANDYGQVGNGNTLNQHTPSMVAPPITWLKIVVGDGHACGLTTSASVLCWGNNDFGQLGDGTIANKSTPVPISDGGPFSDIDANGSTTCGILTDGTIKCWGNGQYGQMGNGVAPVSSNPTPLPSSLAGNTNLQIAVGGSHVCALKNDLTIDCWGKGAEGQLGNSSNTDYSTTITTVIGTGFDKVVAGNLHTCALKYSPPELYCWGDNTNGSVGKGSTGGTNSPSSVPGPFVDVFAGYSHTCAISGTDGSLWCWGLNNMGQLGGGAPTNQLSPINVNP